MTPQGRRLREGAEAAAIQVGDLSQLSPVDLRALSAKLRDGVRALQSTDYVGTSAGQAAINRQHDDLLARTKEVDAEIAQRIARNAPPVTVKVRDDLEVRLIPRGDRAFYRGAKIAVAYSSPTGGAGIYLTPADARRFADALLTQSAKAEES